VAANAATIALKMTKLCCGSEASMAFLATLLGTWGI